MVLPCSSTALPERPRRRSDLTKSSIVGGFEFFIFYALEIIGDTLVFIAPWLGSLLVAVRSVRCGRLARELACKLKDHICSLDIPLRGQPHQVGRDGRHHRHFVLFAALAKRDGPQQRLLQDGVQILRTL